MGAALACRACEHWLRLADVEVRAVGGTNREPDRSAGHCDFARFRVLRALRNSRSVAAIILDDVHPGTARPVAIGHAEVSLVCGHGNSRHDSDQGNLCHPSRLRGNCHSGPDRFSYAKPRSRCQAGKANMALDRSRHDSRCRRRRDRIFLFGNFL